MKRIYCGIGSRETPPEICKKMSNIGLGLYFNNWTLRSGGADGADKAFEKYVSKDKDIILPKEATPESIEIAEKYHPAWGKVVENGWENYHGRNAMIVLGRKLNEPVKFVVCWTKDGEPSGGTALGMRIALDKKIPIFNLYFPDAEEELREFLNPTTHVDLS